MRPHDCTWAKLNTAFQAIRRGVRFVATNPDPTCPVEGGEIPDAAGVIAALEATTGKKVEDVVGKPSPHTVRAALERLELQAYRAAAPPPPARSRSTWTTTCPGSRTRPAPFCLQGLGV